MTSDTFLQHYQQRINTYLQKALSATECASTTLFEATCYSTLSGGKRLRPLLVYSVAKTLAQTQLTTYLANVDRCAAACELLHCYSLVHDDLPAMDDDDWRRGQLACHKQFNEAQAILVGDGLQSLVFSLLTEPMIGIDSQQQLVMISLFANAVGFAGMVGGQAVDLSNQATTLEQLIQMHRLKTGALFKAAMMLGAYCVGCCDKTVLMQLETLADQIGLAYQIQDDIHDVTQTAAKLGKNPHSDQRNSKSTFVSVLGLQSAKAYFDKTYQQAHQSLVQLQFTDTLLAELLNHMLSTYKQVIS